MLIDQLVSQGHVPGYSMRLGQAIVARCARSQKYVLDPPFTAVADELSRSYTSLVTAFAFTRLPYPEVWFECVHSDRPGTRGAALHAPAFQSTPSRVGWLCTATSDDLSAWTAHQFWNLVDRKIGEFVNCSLFCIMYDMKHGVFDPTARLNPREVRKLLPGIITEHRGWTTAAPEIREAMLRHSDAKLGDLGMPLVPPDLSAHEIDKVSQHLTALAASDWAGEVAFLLSTIALLNSRNASETTSVIFGKKHQQARRKAGRLPLHDHHVLKIHRRQRRRAGVEHSSATTAATKLRAHFVTGHFKVRRTGIFFWKPFIRGDSSKGFVTKDYEVAD